MASGACFYEAQVVRAVDGQQTSSIEIVDLNNLDAIDFEKIIINDDVRLGNGKGLELPNFSNVEINGEFDCSNFIISENSVFPNGITSLKCFYSINSLAVLSGILPDTVKTVYVRNAIINSVKKNTDSLESAEKFISLYPNIEVIGKTETLKLSDIIKQKAESEIKNITSQSVKMNNIVIEKNDEPIKKEGFLSIIDVAEKLKKLPEYEKISVKEIKKKLKTFMYVHSDDPQWGSVQNYVPEDKFSDLSYALLNDEDDNNVQSKDTLTKDKLEENNKKLEVAQKNKESETDELKTIKIKKFFDKRVWAAVCKAVRNNKKILLKFLNNINDVNLNPIQKDVRISAGRVACIKNKELKLVPNLDLKGGLYITQGFGRANNRPRLVWCILSGDLLVASSFFPNHGDGKNKCAYNGTILSNTLKEKTEKDFLESYQDYIDVESLLKDFMQEKDLDELSSDVSELAVTMPDAVDEKKETIVESLYDKTVENSDKKSIENQVIEIKPLDKGTVKTGRAKRPRISKVTQEKCVIKSEMYNEIKVLDAPENKEYLSDFTCVKQNNAEDLENSISKDSIVADVNKTKSEIPQKRKRVRKVISIKEKDDLAEEVEKLEKSDVLYHVNYKFEDLLVVINEDILKIKKELLSETDTEKSLNLATSLAKKLKDKQMLESNIDIAKKTFDIFKEYFSTLNGRNR